LPLTAEQAVLLGRPQLAGARAAAAHGCVCCAGVGYRGRMGLFELLPVDEPIAQAIRGGGGEAAVRTLARAAGRADLRDDAASKLLAGSTSFPLVLEAIV
jgi:type II secretory ATPase GspE/PulE/Tfp pilus assembly ATPase PilB-like protein